MDAGHTNFFLHTECHRAFMQGTYSPGKNYGTNIKHEICTVVMDIFTAVTFLAKHPVVESHSLSLSSQLAQSHRPDPSLQDY